MFEGDEGREEMTMLLHVSPNRGRPRVLSRLLGALAISVVGCLAPRAASAQRQPTAPFVNSGTLTIAGYGSAADLDPASNELASSADIARNIDETLVTLDGAHGDRYVPALAAGWTSNADKSVWTFSLRHGVRFHTGRCCMTATDVKYSLSRTMLAGLTNGYVLARFISKPLAQIKILDPYTIQFALGRTEPLFLAALTQNYAELILDATAVKAHATKADPWAHLWATDHDAGTGPYMLQSWARSQQVVLTRFPAYWRGWGGAHFGSVVVRSVSESATRRELVERGQADLTTILTPQDYDQLRSNPKVRVIIGPTTQIDYLPLTQAGPLASPYARQALSYAFNYEAYLKAAFRGYAKRAYGPLASTVLGYDPHMFHYQTDLTKARALFAKAGVKPGTTLTFTYSSGQTTWQTAALILQAQLQQLGITLKLQALDEAAYNSIFYGTEPASKRPNILEFGWWPDYNDPYDECVPLIASWSGGAAGANAGFYHNKAVDALLLTMKNANRETLIHNAQKIQDITSRQDPPALWLDEPAQVAVTTSSLKGLLINPLTVLTYDFYALHR